VSAARSEGELWSRARRGDGDSFAVAIGRYRRELEVHAYRMLGSAEDAEDIVQETFLRAWRKRETFRGQATLRAWLYGITTNASLDLLERRSRRLLPHLVSAPIDPETLPEPSRDISWVRGEMTWLEPYPDRLLDEVVSGEDPPDEAIVARETVELAFLVAIQQLPAPAAGGADSSRCDRVERARDGGDAGDVRRRKQQCATARPRDAARLSPGAPRRVASRASSGSA